MSSTIPPLSPHDDAERRRALSAQRSVLVEAPAGSGKTNLLTRRFLRLLADVEEPGQIVAITFTKAAAAEMRNRILGELEKAVERKRSHPVADDLSMETLADRALAKSSEMGWNLIELPAQLRISTIDSFCRELALQQPLLTELGGGIDILDDPKELYRRAARSTLEQIDSAAPELRAAIGQLLRRRDNGWQEMENLLITMLEKRDRWMQDFVFQPDPNWNALRERLERPFGRAARKQLEELSELLDEVPHARQELLELARFACSNLGNERFRELAEMVEFPRAPFANAEALEEASLACLCAADLLLTSGEFRKQVDKRLGFPAENKVQKERLLNLIAPLATIPNFKSILVSCRDLPTLRYDDDDWEIVRACFLMLRQAAGQLKVEFAAAGAVDYSEVAWIARQVLSDPGEGTLKIAEDIRHLLVDEFQDTSRRQHELLKQLIAAWPQRDGRTCFVVGDPMQSIYFFRDADAELFPLVRDKGLAIPGDLPFTFDHAPLKTNFRTNESLVKRVNNFFEKVFTKEDGSGVRFTAAETPPSNVSGPMLVENTPRLRTHFEFVPYKPKWSSDGTDAKKPIEDARNAARKKQIAEILDVIRSHEDRMKDARAEGRKYRIAVLGRARTVLTPVAEALREEDIAFRAVELEKLKDRPEVRDALTIAHALLNPHDRLAWLGLLRAPWAGLALADLHTLVSADDRDLQKRPVRELMVQRTSLLTEHGKAVVERLLRAVEAAEAWRAARPGTTLGTWIEQAWLRLGGADCVDAPAQANVDLLWRCLDKLPQGDADVPGAALDAALDKLTALPDPWASSDCGVQLMTIHKAKGLEFEVVIVPELQAGGGRSKGELLSWLERGLAEPDEDGEVTEFLVAPISSKGGDKSKTKAWVDSEYKSRERQEARRILYVAATRARDELHLFARPEYKANAKGERQICEPGESLLKTAWPAVKDEISEKFAAWVERNTQTPGVVSALAAVADNIVEMAAPPKSVVLRRLPESYRVEEQAGKHLPVASVSGLRAEPLYGRHEGGPLSRALGVAVHSAFEELARLRATLSWDATRKDIGRIVPRLAAQMRSMGIDAVQAKHIAAQAVEIALDASQDPAAEWILSPRKEGRSEASWVSVNGETTKVVRVDRVFRAGLEPGSDGNEAWWIVDYKTAHANGADGLNVLGELRNMFAPQLEAYANVLRAMHGTDATIRAGLYYPRMKKLDWWEI
jgi:ATP-dependent exoDNAse (exonuclease V) beta subunit